MTDETDKKAPRRRRPRKPRHPLRRIGFTVSEVAPALGQRPETLRRQIERHAVLEGDEQVSRLTGGIVARKKLGQGRWLLTVPLTLRTA